MNLPGDTTELERAFLGNTPDVARDAASAWLREFDAHEPFEIFSITTREYGSLIRYDCHLFGDRNQSACAF